MEFYTFGFRLIYVCDAFTFENTHFRKKHYKRVFQLILVVIIIIIHTSGTCMYKITKILELNYELLSTINRAP